MLFVSDKAKAKIEEIMQEQHMTGEHFVRVSVLGGGCSGLSYKMDFDNKLNPDDQEFEDKGVKMVTDGLNGKGFQFKNPNATRTCACGESFAV